MAKLVTPYSSYAQLEKVTFRVGTSGIAMGRSVVVDQSTGKLNAAGAVTAGDLSIGVINYDDDYVALEGTTTIAAGDQAQVVMSGFTFNHLTGGTFSAGTYVKHAANGLVVAESTTTKSHNTVGIALEAATAAGQTVKVLHKMF